MAIPFITPLPEAPRRTDARPDFALRADVFFAAIDPMRYQMNQLAAWFDNRATGVDNLVASATQIKEDTQSIYDDTVLIKNETQAIREAALLETTTEANRSRDEANRSQDEADKSKIRRDETEAMIAAFDPTGAGLPPITKPNAPLVVSMPQGGVKFSRRALNSGIGVRPALRFDFANQGYLDPRVEFTRASVDWDEHGNEYGIDVPVLMDKGLWVSGTRTNLLSWSADFTQDYWSITRGFIVPGATVAPDGKSLACKFVGEESESSKRLGRFHSVKPNTTYTQSWYVKSAGVRYCSTYFRSSEIGNFNDGNTLAIDLETGEFNAGDGITPVVDLLPDGWFRISITGTTINNPGSMYCVVSLADSLALTHAPSIVSDGTSGIYVWGAQLEEGSRPTSYIPTEDSQVTVAESRPDSISTSGERSLYIDLKALPSQDGDGFYFFNWGHSPTTTIPVDGVLVMGAAAGETIVRVYEDRSYQNIRIPVDWKNAEKFALSFHPDKILVSINGSFAEVATGTDLAQKVKFINPAPNMQGISRFRWVKAISIYERALTAEQLQELTTL